MSAKFNHACISLIFCLCFSSAFAQQLSVAFNTAQTVGKLPYLKKDMNYRELSIGTERPVGNNFLLMLNAGVAHISYDFYDPEFRAVYARHTYINTGIGINRRQPLNASGNVGLIIGSGMQLNLSAGTKKEYRNYSSVNTGRARTAGYNIAAFFLSGIDCGLSASSSLGLQLTAQKDVFAKYKNKTEKILFEKFMTGIIYKMKIKKRKQ